MRVLAFRAWADFAHFRRYYTTSSPLTFSIPPPSAVRGLIAAVLGLSREEYPKVLSTEDSAIGIRLLSPLKKIRLALNYMDTKDGAWVSRRPKGKLHTQVRIEFIKNPKYEIYFRHSDQELMDKFSLTMRESRNIYTPYLGITECIALVKFLWDSDVNEYSGVSKVTSAFKKSQLRAFHFKEGTGILVERVPVHIGNDRVHTKSEEIIFNPHASTILAEIQDGYQHPLEEKGVTFALIG